MSGFKFLALAAVAGIFLVATAPKAQAQVAVEVGSPLIALRLLRLRPYNCVPDGYYGSEWFNGGVFVGVGPWFHGSSDFQAK